MIHFIAICLYCGGLNQVNNISKICIYSISVNKHNSLIEIKQFSNWVTKQSTNNYMLCTRDKHKSNFENLKNNKMSWVKIKVYQASAYKIKVYDHIR